MSEFRHMHDDVGRSTEPLTFRAPPVPPRSAAAKSPVRVDAADRAEHAAELFYARIDSNVDLQVKTGQINDEEDSKVEAARRRVGAPRRDRNEPTPDPIREDGPKKSPDEIMAARLRAAFTEGRRS